MLPITNRDHRSFVFRAKTTINDWIRLILSDRNSRNLLLFLLLNLSFAFVELFYGIATNSLGKFDIPYKSRKTTSDSIFFRTVSHFL